VYNCGQSFGVERFKKVEIYAVYRDDGGQIISKKAIAVA